MLTFTIGASSITIFIDAAIHTIDSTHANFPGLFEQLKLPASDRDLDVIRGFVTVQRMIERMVSGRVTVMDEAVLFDGVEVNGYMTERMIEIMQSGIDIEPWARFMDKLFDNPAEYVREEMYQWLEKGKMPITPDGDFIAFKKVRANFHDVHTGRFDNSVGNILEMDRAGCDPNRHNHCSSGFHFCSPGYLSSFGGQVVIAVKINPRDVTSIPSDYLFTKGRTCRYEVVAQLAEASAAFHGVWKKPVAILEDAAEFPADVLSALVPGYDSTLSFDTLTNVEIEDWDGCEEERADLDKAYAEHEAEVSAAADTITVERSLDPYSGGTIIKVVTPEDGKLADRIADMPVNERLSIANKVRAAVDDDQPQVLFTGSMMTVQKGVKPDVSINVVDAPTATGCNYETAEDLQAAANERDAQRLARHNQQFATLTESRKPTTTTVIINHADVSDIDKQFAGMAAPRKAVKDSKGPGFTTSDDRHFTTKQVKKAVANASSNREAARQLGIGESTLRGWIKKL